MWRFYFLFILKILCCYREITKKKKILYICTMYFFFCSRHEYNIINKFVNKTQSQPISSSTIIQHIGTSTTTLPQKPTPTLPHRIYNNPKENLACLRNKQKIRTITKRKKYKCKICKVRFSIFNFIIKAYVIIHSNSMFDIEI